MNQKKKKFVPIFSMIICIIILSFFLAGCSNQDEGAKLKDKTHEQIHYVDSKVAQMLNSLNNITLTGYKISVQNMEGDSQETAKQGDSQTKGESTGQTTDGEEGQTENIVKYKSIPDTILSQDRSPKWDNLKKDIEILEQSWSSMVLDLAKVGITNEDIIGFSNQLNVVITNLNAENKIDSLTNLAKLYGYLPKYLDFVLEQKEEVHLLETKAAIFNAYAKIETDNWDQMTSDLAQAEASYMKMLEEKGQNTNQYNTDKGYILLKEFQNAVNMKNKEVLYMKYKNVIQELNLL